LAARFSEKWEMIRRNFQALDFCAEGSGRYSQEGKGNKSGRGTRRAECGDWFVVEEADVRGGRRRHARLHGCRIKLREKTFVGDMKLDVRHSRGVDMNLYYRHSRGVPAVEENEEHDAHADDHREGDVQGGRRSVGRICVGGYGEVAGESGIKQ
jgi:hypothetical protein